MDREAAIRAGGKETHYPFTLYWEPHFELRKDGFESVRQVAVQSFTIDGMGMRYRFRTLFEADAKLDELKKNHAVRIAEVAFGLRKGGDDNW